MKNIFKNNNTGPPRRIRLTVENVGRWPNFDKLLKEDKIRFDGAGRLRYKHGAPVGDLVLTKTKKDGTPVYKESASEWFDPDSHKAKEFIWP